MSSQPMATFHPTVTVVDGVELQLEPSEASSSTSSCCSNSIDAVADYELQMNDWSWQQSQISQDSPPPVISSNGTNYRLKVTKQPEEQHRARYLSEGSRGAIKDRSGTSNCTIQLIGFYRPTRVEMFAATGSGIIQPHQLYKLIPVSGKSASVTPCRKMVAHDGIECLEIILRPETKMTAILDCVGILKICSYDAKQRKRFHGTSGGSHSEVKISFRAYIPHEGQANTFTMLKTQTETIRCVQQLGVPEVLKMSINSSAARGGGDLFIIGRNFDRNTTVVFREYKEDGGLAWQSEAAIDKQYLHQCHIVCTIPTYHNLYRGGNVSVTVKCGQKSSHPFNFFYTSSVREDYDDWRPPASPQYNQPNDYVEDYFDFAPTSTFIPAVNGNMTSLVGQKFTVATNQLSYSCDYDQPCSQKYIQLDSNPNSEAKKPRIQLSRP